MKYSLLCVDMDGTLLNSKKEITERTKDALKKAKEAGVKVAISTGRLFTSAYYYADLVGIEAPIISANGAFIREKDRDEVIYKSLLGKENCVKILEVLKKYQLVPNYHTSNIIFTERTNPQINMYMKINDNYPDDKKINIQLVDNWDDVFIKYSDELLKCITINSDIEKVMQAKVEIGRYGELETVSSSNDNFEVMCKGVSKGRGVEILANYYNIPREDIICVGDNENDLSMIEYAGLGVAMGNAEDDIKKAAQYVTSSNDEDGVAEVIEKFIFSN